MAVCASFAHAAPVAGDFDASYGHAVAQARAGDTASALESLRGLLAEHPERQDVLGDYAVVLGWAGEHQQALDLLDRMNRAGLPSYVLEGLAGSARHLKRYPLAQSLYRQVIARNEDGPVPSIGLALTLADAGELDAALAIVTRLREKYPRRPDVLEAFAEVASARHEYFDALAAYTTALSLEPGRKTALRGKIFTLSRIGTPDLALELANHNPGLLSAEETLALGADGTAGRVRWGAIAADAGKGPTRFAMTDRALADSEQASVLALDPGKALSPVDRQLALDRIIALRDRFRMRETIALYRVMAQRSPPVPPYVQAAAASAYLYLEQPEAARDLYRQALAAVPDNLEARLGLFYALVESEQYDAALREIDKLVADTPAYIDAWSPETIRENPAYARVLGVRAETPLYFERPGDAETRLHDLSARAPFNMDIRTGLASAMRARGWPLTAHRELDWILAADPDNGNALAEQAGALLDRRDYRASESALAAATAISAEDKGTLRAAREMRIHNMWEWTVDADTGKSSGGPRGTRDFAVESFLYSPPIDYQYRVFGHLYDAEARFDGGTGRRDRAGVGIEYRSPLLTASGEVSHDISGSRTAGAVALSYTPDDFWTFTGKADTSSNDIPLQAVLAGIDARGESAEVSWRASESRLLSVSIDHMDFTDGNRRNAVQAAWTERMVAGPVYKLDVTASLYASHNSIAGAPYFNPSRDFSPALEFTNEWLQWKRYNRSFHHRLTVTVGDYLQQGYGGKLLAGLRYEQAWALDEQLSVSYGVGRDLHAYDGEQTGRNYAFFSLDWKF